MKQSKMYPSETTKRLAKSLRKETTPAEQILWQHLRNRNLFDLKFRRQHPIGPYVVDFFCHEYKLIIEVDGGIHELKRRSDQNKMAGRAAFSISPV